MQKSHEHVKNQQHVPVSNLDFSIISIEFVYIELLHRNSTVARRVTNDTSEHYGNP